MTTAITTRTAKGSALLWTEEDANFTNLRDALDNYVILSAAEITALQGGQSGGTLGFTTQSLMNADLAHNANTLAKVTNDTTALYNGLYIKLGVSGSGSWQRAIFQDQPFVLGSMYSNDLAVAVSAIGSTLTTLLYYSDLTLSANISIPATLELMPINGAKINHTTYTLEYLGITNRWPTQQIFNGTGLITGLKETKPEWWGATGTGDATNAVNAAIVCARTNTRGGKVLLSQLYNVTSINISSSIADYNRHLIIEGKGPYVSGFIGTDVASIVVDTIGSNYITLNEFSISGTGKIGLLRARSTTSHASSAHVTHNLWIEGNWIIAAVVSIASETNNDYNPWWGNSNTTSPTVFICSPYNTLAITSPNGTIYESSNTDNRMYGGVMYCYSPNAIVARFIDASEYKFYGTAITNGANSDGILCQYELSGSHGIVFNGPITWDNPLFEGGNPKVHWLKGVANAANTFYNINSLIGYYNIYDSGAQVIMGYYSSGTTTAALAQSTFTPPKVNPTAIPSITLYTADTCNLDIINTAGSSILTFLSYQGPGNFKAGTINWALASLNFHPEDFGTAAPISGSWPKGSIRWNTGTTITNGIIGWYCAVAGSPGTWFPFITAISNGNFASNALAIAAGVPGGCLYFNTTVSALSLVL